MEFLTDYGIFLAKLSTFVFFLILIAGIVIIFISRSRQDDDGHLEIKNINRRFENMNLVLQSHVQGKKEFKQSLREFKARHKKKDSHSGKKPSAGKLFVLDFKGDIKATEVASLREEITALLTVATDTDQVLVRVESAGGTVHGYGLAASQLKRIRDRNIHLTAAVDKVAASGGYMMACVADHIIAAPFAIIGSVGVLGQLPNFHRLLKKHDIDFEQVSAGEYKRTLTLFGENTDEDRERFKQEIEETHELFKEFVAENRSQVDIDKIATGQHWYGKRALDLKLVDELRTSDDYLGQATSSMDAYEIRYVRKKPLIEKLFSVGIRFTDYFS